VLLADDNADMRDYMRRLLGAHFDVEAVADGEAALAAVDRRLPDLVLSDVMMPGLDGAGLVARLRADPRTNTLPIILLSARAGEEAKLEGLSAGADDYLIKPFSARELVAHVTTNIKIARIPREAMEAELRARLEIAESERRFRALADSAPALIWINGSEGCEYVNLGYLDFVGTDDRGVGGDGWERFIHPDDREDYLDAYAQAFASRSLFDAELRFRRHDGEYRWLRSIGRPRLGADGELLGYAGISLDITERKQAEQTQQLLVNELNHRVKNTLASVQAIAQHTLRRTRNSAEFVASFSGRIQSLSRVHSILSSSNWKGADLRQLIRDQLLLGSVDEMRLTAQGPVVQLEPQTALHMALMLHELGTNAIKYGALSRRQGRVVISWTVEGGMLRLRWMERGGPPVRAPSSPGFGMTLIEQSVKGEGGDARLSLEADGIVWEIAVPLARAQTFDRLETARPAAAAPSGMTSREGRLAERVPKRLEGKRLLVVEDEPLVALDIIACLKDAGAEVGEPMGTVDEALQIVKRATFDGALLDGNLRGQKVDEIAAALTRRNIRFLFVSGYGPESLPQAFQNAVVISKPFSPESLVEAAARLVQPSPHIVRLRD
jgi:PAS domain S-box-containing protein